MKRTCSSAFRLQIDWLGVVSKTTETKVIHFSFFSYLLHLQVISTVLSMGIFPSIQHEPIISEMYMTFMAHSVQELGKGLAARTFITD